MSVDDFLKFSQMCFTQVSKNAFFPLLISNKKIVDMVSPGLMSQIVLADAQDWLSGAPSLRLVSEAVPSF